MFTASCCVHAETGPLGYYDFAILLGKMPFHKLSLFLNHNQAASYALFVNSASSAPAFGGGMGVLNVTFWTKAILFSLHKQGCS
jgi:hypothetical protein